MEETTPRPTFAELEAYFETAELPTEYRINEGELVNDVPKFVTSHIRTIKANPGSRANDPFMDRLIKLKEQMEGE
jgi:hypothetical protein